MATNYGELQINSEPLAVDDEIILQRNQAIYGVAILADADLFMKSLDYEVKAFILGSGAILCYGGMLELLDAKSRQKREEGRDINPDTSLTSPEPSPA